MLRVVFVCMVWCTISVHAASMRGHELVFNITTTHPTRGRALANGALWYVNSGSVPPPGCVATEAVAPGVYLARGEASASFPRGLWLPEMKYDPKMIVSHPPRFPVFGVQVRTDSEFFKVEGCVTKLSGTHRFSVSCSTDKLLDLANDDRVLWISAIPRMKLHSYESRLLMMGANSALNGSGTRVAVSDTGLDWKHCAFYEGSAPPFGSIDTSRVKVVGVMKSNGGDYVAVTGAHGTATAGVAAGYPCMSETGVAPQAKIWFLDASSGDQYLDIPPDLASRIVASGATVHSASWGSYTDGEYIDTDSEFDSMSRAHPTVCHVRSAGNDGPVGVVGATNKNGLVVGACLSRAAAYPSMSPTQRASNPDLYSYTSQIDFSSAGPAADGRLIPQVCAPGFRVDVPYAVNPGTVNHADFAYASGTSFSAPGIAGVIANLQQRWKDTHAGALPNCALLEATLMAHAVKPTRVVEQVGSTLTEISAPPITTLGTPILDFTRWTDVDGVSVTSTGRQALCFENLDTEPWTVVMRWTDVAAVAGASAPLINDLDMVLVGATGTVLLVEDAINNFEIVQSWPAQHTRMIVSAFQGVSTFGSQPFSVHIKGKATQVTCDSALLPAEYTNCTGGQVAVDSWTGSFSCDFQTCPANTCGSDCARTCDLARPCTPTSNGGSGYFDESNVCRPHSCPAYTFVTDTVCKCKIGSAKPCSNDQMASCLSSGAFAVCPAGSSSSNMNVVASGGVVPLSVNPFVLVGWVIWGYALFT